MTTATNYSALQQLLGEVLAADSAESFQARAAADTELVADAAAYAQMVFGKDAAALLGTWTAVDEMDSPADTAQAMVHIDPRAVLLYSIDGEGERGLSVSATCHTCGHTDEIAVRSLLDLGRALRQTGSLR